MKGQAQLKRLTELQARALLERLRWPDSPTCPKCGCKEFYGLKGAAGKRGLRQCKAKTCKKLYSVTMGTVMERSHIKMWQWVYAFAAMTASKKGISAHQLHRELGVTYKAAWFMAARVRYALRQPYEGKLGGPGKVVSMDETYAGGKPRHPNGPRSEKTPVVTLVEHGGGVRTRVAANVKASTLRKLLLENADVRSVLMTDENSSYVLVGKKFKEHRTVLHSAREYARREQDGSVTHSNTAESYFAILKRGMYGVFHHCSPVHLQRYVDEFDFRWNNRKLNDTERATTAMSQVGGKRLYYRKPKGLIQGGILSAPKDQAQAGPTPEV